MYLVYILPLDQGETNDPSNLKVNVSYMFSISEWIELTN